MRCIFCGSILSKVVDKRGVDGTGEIRRRRECLKCKKRYTTYERAVAAELVVLKKDGRREPFSRDKLLSGIHKALEKRPSATVSEIIADKIENKLRVKGVSEISSKAIGRSVLTELKKVDQVAYLRFASVYRHFDNPIDFAKELKSLEITLQEVI
jgi:transcriptional repressor NrdR